MMKKLPYAIANFMTIREEDYVYVDRTSYIRRLENLSGRSLMFVRPRRFGKSLWLNVLSRYYDLALSDKFEMLFNDLDIGKNPTPLHNRYFVLEWDFSRIDSRGSVDDIADRMNETLNSMIEEFLMYYEDFLPATVAIKPQAINTLGNLLSSVAKTPYKLFLLIDEYDNFANEVVANEESAYKGLVQKEGPLKTLYKGIKEFMKRTPLDRIFITGVSPVVMSDITSGANIFTNIYPDSEFNALCGFTKQEVRTILLDVVNTCGMKQPVADDAMRMMEIWYNGFLFSHDSTDRIYNPTLVLYFLEHFIRRCDYPRQILDSNLAADEGKLECLGKTVSGRQAVIDVFQTDEPLIIDAVSDRFTLSSMLDRLSQDNTFLASYLYYFGMLTITGTDALGRVCLAPPNLVMKKLYADQILRFLLPLGTDRNEAKSAVDKLIADNDLNPLLTFAEQKLFPVFSNRDYKWMNEFTVKMAFTTLLFNDITYALFSEPELSKGYADLCLILRPDARKYQLHDMLFEFKYVTLDKLNLSGEQIRNMDEKELLQKTPVKKAFNDAKLQIRRYADVLDERFGRQLRLKTYIVVSVGFERLFGEEHTDPSLHIRHL
ncbi:MAG: AAA family ATPase [Desulfobacteraceae bacterium]|nr:AAA family ATPase [Desulfobacteraceae bacterium]